jgi:hypothetical protein
VVAHVPLPESPRLYKRDPLTRYTGSWAREALFDRRGRPLVQSVRSASTG